MRGKVRGKHPKVRGKFACLVLDYRSFGGSAEKGALVVFGYVENGEISPLPFTSL
jgi:hypothetical protein